MFDHYIAIDWALSNMAIARMTGVADTVRTHEGPASIKDVVLYLNQLKGKCILTIEESTSSQWLYTELKEHVEEILVCDPYRNRLLSEGAKTDKIDAIKLVQLLRAGLLKPVFHSGDEFIYLRKLVSGYIDLVKTGTQIKNQRTALFLAVGKNHKEKELNEGAEKFVLEGLDRRISSYKEERKRYEDEFKSLAKKHKAIRLLKTLPGIKYVNAVKIASRVVDPHRFPTPGHFLSYCGLIKLDRISGKKIYGRKNPRYCRLLKDVFKMAAVICIREKNNNALRDYYLYLIDEKKLPTFHARHAVARRLAILSWGILKNGKPFDPMRRTKCKSQS